MAVTLECSEWLSIYRGRTTTNQQFYGDLPPVSLKAKQRRMREACHCMRHSKEEASKIVLWISTDGHPNRGRRKVTFIDNLLQDTDLESVQDLQTVMQDREHWRSRVDSVVKCPERQWRLNYDYYFLRLFHQYSGILSSDECQMKSFQ